MLSAKDIVSEETVAKEITSGEDQWPDLGSVVGGGGGVSSEEERKETARREEQARLVYTLTAGNCGG